MQKSVDLKISVVYLSIILAFVLWFMMFVVRPFNFWILMSISTVLLSVISFVAGRPIFKKTEFNFKNVLLGIFFALILYGIFWTGNRIIILMTDMHPALSPFLKEKMNLIYANRDELPVYIVGILLFFPIGFGEEIFWRGFIQKYFTHRWNAPMAVIITTVLYTAVHLPTGNPVLIMASLTCGLFWGSLYWFTGNLVPVVLSHMVWDVAVFVLWPFS